MFLFKHSVCIYIKIVSILLQFYVFWDQGMGSFPLPVQVRPVVNIISQMTTQNNS